MSQTLGPRGRATHPDTGVSNFSIAYLLWQANQYTHRARNVVNPRLVLVMRAIAQNAERIGGVYQAPGRAKVALWAATQAYHESFRLVPP